MRRRIEIAVLFIPHAVLVFAIALNACEPKPAQPATTPEHDAGASSAPSASKVCANLDTKLHCTNLWPASTTCTAAVASLKAHAHTSHLLPCYVTAPSCAYAHDNCKE